MNLKHIKQELCPHCGSQVVSEYKSERLHCNGTSEELRTFSCGFKLRYYPNFPNNIEVSDLCTKSKEYKEKETLKLEREEKVLRYMKKTLKLRNEEIKEIISGLWRNI